MMQSLSYLTLSLLCSLSLLSSGLSIQCPKWQYAWPFEKPHFCCDKCPPGQHLVRRAENSCDRQCKPCTGERYIDIYSVKLTCTVCDDCKNPNMERKTNCSITHNTVCGCKAGYRCEDQHCTVCVLIPTTTTTKPTLPPSTTVSKPGALTTLWATSKPISKDTVWFLVITGLLCAGIALLVVTKLKQLLRCIRSNCGYFLPEKLAQQPPCPEENEVSKPVQEVCGKCDQLIDVCVKD